jgi:Carboxypeptidase regulatory-like domain/TonB dependent receptor-like, beta-barrel
LVLVGLLLALLLSRVLIAQTTNSGGLTGVVTDPSHAVVPDADVEVKDNLKGTHQLTKTDREGVYRFFFLAPSAYTLRVTHAGFREERRALNVFLGPPGTVNVPLEIAKTSSEITVTGEAPKIQAENGDVSTTLDQKQISEVPNPGNDLTYIAQTAPGVIMNSDSGMTGGIQGGAANFSILGMPGTSYSYTMDGMNIADNGQNFIAGGSLGLVLGQNQVEEATVISTGYSAQFGQAAGGNINYLTKSGSNGFHGNAQYYWNGRVFNANDWISNALGVPRPFSIANQWAGSVGGPIRKDRLFFFVDSEGLRLLIPQILTIAMPSPDFESAALANIDSRFGQTSASDAFYKQVFSLYNAAPGAASAVLGGFDPVGDPTGCTGFIDKTTGLGITKYCAVHFITTRGRPSQDALTSGRLDWIATNSDRIFLRVQGEKGLGAFYTDSISPGFDSDYNVSLWQGQFVETHFFGSAAANQLLVAGSEHSFFWQTSHPAQALAALPTALNFNVPGTFNSLGTNGVGAYGCDCKQYQLSDDAVKTRGKQKLGFGVNVERISWRLPPNPGNTLGTLSPQTLDAFYQGGIDPVTYSTDISTLTQSFTSQSAISLSFINSAVYGQDEWHASPNLTLTFALRAEHYSNPFCNNHCFSRPDAPFDSISHDPNQPYNQAILTNQDHALLGLDNILWSPRFGFAWQPLGVSHNSVLRGGVGIFYDPLPANLSYSFFLNAPNFNTFSAFSGNLAPKETNSSFPSLFQTTSDSNTAFVNGFAAGNTFAQMKATVANFVPPSLTVSERKMHLPQYQRWSLEWQQAIGAHTSASIGYFGHHGIHELELNSSANAFGFGSLPAQPADSRFSQVTQYHSDAISNYNGIVVSFRHEFTRFGNGLVQVNYTYSRAFDEVSNGGFFGFTSGSSTSPQDPANLRGAYGPADYDVRHSLNANYVWELPVKAALGGRGPEYLVKGWQISGTIFAHTGFPYTVFDNAESVSLQHNNYFGEVYAVPVGPLPAASSCGKAAAFTNPIHTCLPAQFSVTNGTTVPNPNALFLQAGCETGFNVGHLGAPGVCDDGPTASFSQGRNRFRAPAYFNTDFGIMKNTKIPGWESATLGIGFQFFNLFNHPNFGIPEHWTDAFIGEIFYQAQPPTSILGSGLGGDVTPRMIQLKAQLKF